jgi:hypothetical protein
MSFRRSLVLSLALFFPALFATSGFAQAIGSIRGTVVDNTSALIPAAQVTLTSTGTGVTRTATTNQTGIFVFPDVPIGGYDLQISKSGFRTEQRKGLTLLTGQVIDLQLPLTAGAANQSVDVVATTALIETGSSAVTTTIDRTEIGNLPLNGRNPLTLTTLTPGAALTATGTESGQQDNTGLVVNGLRPTENTFLLDNAIYNDRFFDSVPILPNPDALQEFTIQSSNYSAEYPGAGSLVQLSTRSGTNHIHGSAYEYLRNTVLDAYNHFVVKTSTGALVKPPFKLNQFGGTIGGPILRDRTFLFFSAEDLQQRSSPNPVTFFIPTPAEIGGDFSALTAQLHDPVTLAPYAGNIVTRAASPLSLAVYKTYLAGLNANSAGEVTLSPNTNTDSTQYLVKIDHELTDSNHLSGRYFYNEDNFQRSFTAPTGFYAENHFRNQSAQISDRQNFSPTLTGTVAFYAGRFARTQIPEAPGLKSLQNLGQNVALGTDVPIFPGIRDNISGYVDVFSGGALTQDSTSFDEKATLVKVLRAHTVTFGGDFERTRIDANDFSFTPGDNQFTGVRTGSALADFYLGYESTFTQDNGRTFYLRENRPALFVQDDWKTTRDLTLNLGLRWEPWLPPTDLNDSLVGFVPGYRSTVAPNAPVGLQFIGDPGVQNSIYRKHWNDFGPRIGFAYNVGGHNKLVVRGAYGLFYGFPEGLLYQRTDETQPRDTAVSIPNPTNPWDNIFAGTTDPFPAAHIPLSQFGTYKFQLPVAGGVLDPASNVAKIQDRNLTVEYQVNNTTAVSIAYVGNLAQHIMGSRQFNPAVYGPGATLGNEQSRRLYQGIGAVEMASSYEYENYNAIQLNVTRRVSNGLHVLTNLTWGKIIDNTSSATEGNTGPPNPFNLNSSRGPADYDVKLRYNLALNYDVRHFSVSHLEGTFINGWQLNTILNASSGTPITVLSGTDRSLSGVGNDYADYVAGQKTARPAGASFLKEYFNTAAFQQAAIGTFGDTSRGILRGPGYLEVDASGVKSIPVSERVNLQFRAEAFNLINRSNYANPGSTVASAATFGAITSAQIPRELQFALRAQF